MSRNVSFILLDTANFFFKCCVISINLGGTEDLGEQIGLKNVKVCLESCSYYQLNINVVPRTHLVKNPRSPL